MHMSEGMTYIFRMTSSNRVEKKYMFVKYYPKSVHSKKHIGLKFPKPQES